MKKRKVRRISANYMDVVYVHNPDLKWTVNDKDMVVLDMEHTGAFDKIAQKFFHRPKVSHISLDKYGTEFWRAIDGKRDVWDVVEHMQKCFPDQERMLDRAIAFLQSLEKNKFIQLH